MNNAENSYLTLADSIRKTILDRYAQCGNSKTKTAKSLGIARATLYRKLTEYGVL